MLKDVVKVVKRDGRVNRGGGLGIVKVECYLQRTRVKSQDVGGVVSVGESLFIEDDILFLHFKPMGLSSAQVAWCLLYTFLCINKQVGERESNLKKSKFPIFKNTKINIRTNLICW